MSVSVKHTIHFGFLFPVVNSDFNFKKLRIGKGLYLIDISNKTNWKGNKLKTNRNVGILVIPDQLKKIYGGATKIEKNLDIFLLYCFIKTSLTYVIEKGYLVYVNGGNKLILDSKKSIDFFKEFGLVFLPYYSFFFGTKRDNILTENLYNRLSKSKAFFKNYSSLYLAQLSPHWKSPLGVAMDIFSAAFCNEARDETQFILLVTALESLFIKSSTELTFRLSSNITKFLYPNLNNYKNRRDAFEKVKKLYNIRSQIVHGIYREIEPQEYDEIFELFSKIIGKLLEKDKIYKIFMDSEKHQEFIKRLELG